MKTFIKWLLPGVILVVAFFGMKALINSKKPPARQAAPEAVTLVDFITVKQGTLQPRIQLSGTVMPSQSVELRTQVGGEVIEIHPRMEPGGTFNKGEVLVRIDPRDYALRVKRAEAEVERARFELQTEKGRAAVAEEEWALLGSEVKASESGRELSLRIPHLRRAEAALTAAISALDEAKLNLERTTLVAPFPAQVRLESVEVGQVVSPQTVIAQLTGTRSYWVQTSIQVDQLPFVELPNSSGQGGAEAVVTLKAGESEIQRSGKVVRLLGGLEQAGRMARLLVEVPDPIGLDADAGKMPLLLDAFVRVEILGKPIENVCEIPAASVREGQLVWVVGAEDRLEIRETAVAWRERERVLVTKGLAPGDRLITSRIATPLHGMKLQPQAKAEAAASGAAHE